MWHVKTRTGGCQGGETGSGASTASSGASSTRTGAIEGRVQHERGASRGVRWAVGRPPPRLVHG
jgi:hypothetical protein